MPTRKSYMSNFSFNTNNGYNTSVLLDKINYNEYIKIFWVGLMDGDGSIQVNHWRGKSLQYRLIIKLSNFKSNSNMLIEIAKVVGGTVKITDKGTNVIWVVNKKQEVEEIIKIYDTYPPITSKKICQLAYLKTCLIQTSVKIYLLNRNFKYNKQLTIIKSNINFKTPSYFKVWLSGFIEAEGCFSIRKSNNHSFSIGQNDDVYLIDAIKQYFKVTNKVRNPKGKFYFLEVYKIEVLLRIITHCINYPLLGEKLESLKEFSNILSNKQSSLLDSGLNQRPLSRNKIKFFHTKQFNRGLSTLKLSENTVDELSNNELNLELFPIDFDDASRAILDLPFTLGNNSLKLINKRDGSINHYFYPKKTKSFLELEKMGYAYDIYYNMAYHKKYTEFISKGFAMPKKAKIKNFTMSELIKSHLILDKGHFIYVRVGQDSFATLTQCKKHYTKLVNNRLQYLEPIVHGKTLQRFEFKNDPFELTETNTNLKKIKANPKSESMVDNFLINFLPLLFNQEDGYICSSQYYDSEKNRSDLQIIYKNNKNEMITILIIENKSVKGDGYYDMLSQACKYSDNDVSVVNAYIMTMKGTLVSFYAYIQDYHSSNKFCLKGSGVDGLLGLYFDWTSMCIKIVPQVNTFIPQAIYYDFDKAKTCINTRYSILAILNFISTQYISPDLIDNFSYLAEIEEGTLNKENKNQIAKLVMKSLVEELKLDLNYDLCDTKKPTKVLGTSNKGNKKIKHTIDFSGRVKIW